MKQHVLFYFIYLFVLLFIYLLFLFFFFLSFFIYYLMSLVFASAFLSNDQLLFLNAFKDDEIEFIQHNIFEN